ncbi:GNAT family N-acetyltransferase [Xylanimonas oleitrophica]|uniref:GNAT family N-acetyltransferase n=1 Tax=Xylanimonas oleitrophica TaxID=2607479 RepID=A0A2W5WQX0_9MICO|nr:GNAT family N-acetyltransferase [Xylanimonas oleitrophica]PZR53113.1 GNAT family N-acetyltransferase [Xylanimonas oleitrophica]
MDLRPFDPADAEPLTRMLHRAYAELGAQGLNFTAVDQSVATTLYRASAGASWVITEGDAIVATVAVSCPPGEALRGLSAEAGRPGRAWVNQLAVAPEHRGAGLARRLLDHGLAWARTQGATSVGIDTAEPATHLLALYQRWGFARVETIQWPGKVYRSAVLVRPLDPP